MFGLGLPELLLILVIGLIFFGPGKLPEIGSALGKSMKEFKPEIEAAREAYRFRVDRISGKDNNRHKVERVRVNSADNKSEKDFRDVYGSQIVK